jgi:peptidyl-prolyl cis-trans isomerase A (cyclophilin A)
MINPILRNVLIIAVIAVLTSKFTVLVRKPPIKYRNIKNGQRLILAQMAEAAHKGASANEHPPVPKSSAPPSSPALGATVAAPSAPIRLDVGPVVHIDLKTLARSKIYADIFTRMGVISIHLLPQRCPNTVKNFIALAEGDQVNHFIEDNHLLGHPFYDGLLIFRTVFGVFVQMGDFFNTGVGHSYFVDSADDVQTRADAINLGMVVMAQQQGSVSATQFYIALTNMKGLVGGNHNFVIGRVSRGLDVAEKISHLETDFLDHPITKIQIEGIRLRQIKE